MDASLEVLVVAVRKESPLESPKLAAELSGPRLFHQSQFPVLERAVFFEQLAGNAFGSSVARRERWQHRKSGRRLKLFDLRDLPRHHTFSRSPP